MPREPEVVVIPEPAWRPVCVGDAVTIEVVERDGAWVLDVHHNGEHVVVGRVFADYATARDVVFGLVKHAIHYAEGVVFSWR